MKVQIKNNRLLQIGLEYETNKAGKKVCVGYIEKAQKDGPFEMDDVEAKRLLAKKDSPIEEVGGAKKAKKESKK